MAAVLAGTVLLSAACSADTDGRDQRTAPPTTAGTTEAPSTLAPPDTKKPLTPEEQQDALAYFTNPERKATLDKAIDTLAENVMPKVKNGTFINLASGKMGRLDNEGWGSLRQILSNPDGQDVAQVDLTVFQTASGDIDLAKGVAAISVRDDTYGITLERADMYSQKGDDEASRWYATPVVSMSLPEYDSGGVEHRYSSRNSGASATEMAVTDTLAVDTAYKILAGAGIKVPA